MKEEEEARKREEAQKRKAERTHGRLRPRDRERATSGVKTLLQ